ncbi:MAG: hypothetical protein R3F11_31940 [Verrucomicrobiales bacterium]
MNRFLIEGLARAGGGEPYVVTKSSEAKAAAGRLKAMVESSIMTRLAVEFDGVDAYDLELAALPDLLAERPVVVIGKYRGKPEGTLKLSGISGGKERTKAIAFTAAADDGDTAAPTDHDHDGAGDDKAAAIAAPPTTWRCPTCGRAPASRGSPMTLPSSTKSETRAAVEALGLTQFAHRVHLVRRRR